MSWKPVFNVGHLGLNGLGPIAREELQMSWKPVMQTDSTGKWYENSLRFETKEEALTSARDLMNRWMLVLAADAHESNDPVNAQLTDDKLELI